MKLKIISNSIDSLDSYLDWLCGIPIKELTWPIVRYRMKRLHLNRYELQKVIRLIENSFSRVDDIRQMQNMNRIYENLLTIRDYKLGLGHFDREPQGNTRIKRLSGMVLEDVDRRGAEENVIDLSENELALSFGSVHLKTEQIISCVTALMHVPQLRLSLMLHWNTVDYLADILSHMVRGIKDKDLPAEALSIAIIGGTDKYNQLISRARSILLNRQHWGFRFIDNPELQTGNIDQRNVLFNTGSGRFWVKTFLTQEACRITSHDLIE